MHRRILFRTRAERVAATAVRGWSECGAHLANEKTLSPLPSSPPLVFLLFFRKAVRSGVGSTKNGRGFMSGAFPRHIRRVTCEVYTDTCCRGHSHTPKNRFLGDSTRPRGKIGSPPGTLAAAAPETTYVPGGLPIFPLFPSVRVIVTLVFLLGKLANIPQFLSTLRENSKTKQVLNYRGVSAAASQPRAPLRSMNSALYHHCQRRLSEHPSQRPRPRNLQTSGAKSGGHRVTQEPPYDLLCFRRRRRHRRYRPPLSRDVTH
jgi:hypothetical protein